MTGREYTKATSEDSADTRAAFQPRIARPAMETEADVPFRTGEALRRPSRPCDQPFSESTKLVHLLKDVPVCNETYVPLDFMLLPYVPPTNPCGKLAPGALLLASLRCCARQEFIDTFLAALHELTRILGQGRIVWGFKIVDGQPVWELYLYRHAGAEEPSRLFAAISRHLPNPFFADARLPKHIPFTMFSIDLVPHALTLDYYNVYFSLSSESGHTSRALSFLINANDPPRYQNYYTGYSKNKSDELFSAIRNSPFVGPTVRPEGLLVTRFATGETVAHAIKASCAGLYFCRVGIDTSIDFLDYFGYPPLLVDYLRDNRAKFDHILFDLGCDYRAEGDHIVFTKSAIFGTI